MWIYVRIRVCSDYFLFQLNMCFVAELLVWIHVVLLFLLCLCFTGLNMYFVTVTDSLQIPYIMPAQVFRVLELKKRKDEHEPAQMSKHSRMMSRTRWTATPFYRWEYAGCWEYPPVWTRALTLWNALYTIVYITRLHYLHQVDTRKKQGILYFEWIEPPAY